MEPSRLRHFHSRLQDERTALDAITSSRAASTGTVELDQSASGRVTRMDAMQQQAMAQAEQTRAATRRLQIDAAIGRINEGTYGVCPGCEQYIDERRLEAEPTAILCIACAAAREQG